MNSSRSLLAGVVIALAVIGPLNTGTAYGTHQRISDYFAPAINDLFPIGVYPHHSRETDYGLHLADCNLQEIPEADRLTYLGTDEPDTTDSNRILTSVGFGGGDTFSRDTGTCYSGGAGNDKLTAVATVPHEQNARYLTKIFGQSGQDVIVGPNVTSLLVGGDGNDYIKAGNSVNQISGGAGSDTLIGGANRDVIYADSGSDKINAGTGDDYLFTANRARDRVNCGPGKDIIYADRNDKLVGCETVRHRTSMMPVASPSTINRKGRFRVKMNAPFVEYILDVPPVIQSNYYLKLVASPPGCESTKNWSPTSRDADRNPLGSSRSIYSRGTAKPRGYWMHWVNRAKKACKGRYTWRVSYKTSDPPRTWDDGTIPAQVISENCETTRQDFQLTGTFYPGTGAYVDNGRSYMDCYFRAQLGDFTVRVR